MKVLLFSGGIESTCLALTEQPDLAVNIDYGQVCAQGERQAAEHIAKLLGISLTTIDAPLSHLGRGEMTGVPQPKDTAVPEHWPYRNQLLVTLAAMSLPPAHEHEIIIGTVKSDHVHADGSEAFVKAMSSTLAAQYSGVRLSAPAIKKSTADLIGESGADLGLLGWAFSCHRSNLACGQCRGCNKSRETLSSVFS